MLDTKDTSGAKQTILTLAKLIALPNWGETGKRQHGTYVNMETKELKYSSVGNRAF